MYILFQYIYIYILYIYIWISYILINNTGLSSSHSLLSKVFCAINFYSILWWWFVSYSYVEFCNWNTFFLLFLFIVCASLYFHPTFFFFCCILIPVMSRCAGLVAPWHVGSWCPNQRSSPHPLHCKANS